MTSHSGCSAATVNRGRGDPRPATTGAFQASVGDRYRGQREVVPGREEAATTARVTGSIGRSTRSPRPIWPVSASEAGEQSANTRAYIRALATRFRLRQVYGVGAVLTTATGASANMFQAPFRNETDREPACKASAQPGLQLAAELAAAGCTTRCRRSRRHRRPRRPPVRLRGQVGLCQAVNTRGPVARPRRCARWVYSLGER